jgi:large subunit ribosomal protein L21
MYAVIETGGKQYRVEQGETLEVERLHADDGAEVDLRPVLLVDGDKVLATPSELSSVTVTARVVGDARGPKIDGFVYKPKSNQRRRYGHRQHLSRVEIVSIGAKPKRSPSRSRSTKAKQAAEGTETAEASDASKDE